MKFENIFSMFIESVKKRIVKFCHFFVIDLSEIEFFSRLTAIFPVVFLLFTEL